MDSGLGLELRAVASHIEGWCLGLELPGFRVGGYVMRDLGRIHEHRVSEILGSKVRVLGFRLVPCLVPYGASLRHLQ